MGDAYRHLFCGDELLRACCDVLLLLLGCCMSRPPKWALAVTIMQLSQMAIGVIVTISHMQILTFHTVPNCDGHIPNLTGALTMYASYFVLFAQFLFGRYCKRHDSKALGRKLQ